MKSSEHKFSIEDFKYVLSITRELSGERDIPTLLNLILTKSREVTKADAGSVYVLEPMNVLRFKATQNHSVSQNLAEFTLPVDETTLVGRAVIQGKVINTPDLFAAAGEGLTTKTVWDKKTGYETKSVLTVPMFDVNHRVIGVIQLINRKKKFETKLKRHADFVTDVIAFDSRDEEFAVVVAQLAGAALENAILTHEIENVLEGFVHAAVVAIEQRDPTTSGHSHRVARLAMALAKEVDRIDKGPYRDTKFTRDQMKEIQYASLLHDFGKIGVREEVLVKSKKLFPWQMSVVKERFRHARACVEVNHLRRITQLTPDRLKSVLSGLEKERIEQVKGLQHMWETILSANEPTVLEQAGFDHLKKIGDMSFISIEGEALTLLEPDELAALSVAKGSLTPKEFAEIQTHVVHTYNFLKKIPWGRTIANIPEIAGKHHEKLDGSGYPWGVHAESIPVQSRIMTIVDIFDALTATDRPYKKSVPHESALNILKMDADRGRLDAELLRIFIEAEVFRCLEDGVDEAA